MKAKGFGIESIHATDFSDVEIKAGRIDWPSLRERVGASIVDLDVRLNARAKSSIDIDMLDLSHASVSWHTSASITMVRSLRHLKNTPDDVTVTIPFSGCFIAEQDGLSSEVKPGQAVLLRAGRPSTLEVSRRCEFIGLRLSHALWAERLEGLQRGWLNNRGPHFLNTEAPAFRLLQSYFFGLRTVQADLSLLEGALVQRHIVELLDACMISRDAVARPVTQPVDLGIVRQTAQGLMMRHYQDATATIADIAEWMGSTTEIVEASFAAERTSFDLELMKIRMGQLGKALHDPEGSRRSIADLALSNGIDDMTDLISGFELFFGTDPDTYRRTRPS